MTSVAGKPTGTSIDSSREPTQAFAQFTRLAAIAGGLIGVVEIAWGLATNTRELYELGALTWAVGLVSLGAFLLARSHRPTASVILWGMASSLILSLLPIVYAGLLPLIMLGSVANLLIAALFGRTQRLWRLSLALAVLFLVPVALEVWWPAYRPNLMTSAPLIPLAIYPSGIVVIAVLAIQFSGTWQRAVESAQAYAAELEQGRARLLDQTGELRATTAELVTRTGQLEKLNLELQTLGLDAQRRTELLVTNALVTHAVSQMRNLEELLPRVALLIGQAFGYYHVGIYLTDELGRFAVLRAASSEGGKRMMESGHKVPLSPDTIIGAAISLGQPRTECDTGPDAVQFGNPDLPLTHSRLVLPMIVGQQTLGAVDCHSEQDKGFNEEDISNLGALADQIAIAIENASLFAQTQAALQEAQEAQSRYLRQQWERLLPTLRTASHEYRVTGVPSASNISLPEIEQALQGETVAVRPSPEAQAAYAGALAVPIKLRDQVIGVIDLHETDQARDWTDDEVALVTEVADQAAQALETARLFEQTQQLARREQLVSSIAAKLRASPDVESVLRTTVHEIRRALGTTHGAIRLKTKDEQATTQNTQAAAQN
jgi:GAF domain-containing protein